MLKKLSYILLVFQTCLTGLMLGVFYTLFSGSADGQGLAAGGILVFNAFVGLTVGVLIGVFMVVKMEHNATANKIVAIINLIFLITLILVIKANT